VLEEGKTNTQNTLMNTNHFTDVSEFKEINSNSNITQTPRARWKKLSNVMRSISLMRHHTVKTLGNAESITEEIVNSPKRSHNNTGKLTNLNFTKDAV
jgi:hypothetical protein